jgi:hypothetical protein
LFLLTPESSFRGRTMKRIVSFCVFGSDPIYRVGALANVALAQEHYPGWTPRFYVSTELPAGFAADLRALGAEVVMRAPCRPADAMLWRARPMNERRLDALIVRDADSRISGREAAAVEEWLASGRGFHIMRDHPDHCHAVMGGMWGCRANMLPHFPVLHVLWRVMHRARGSRAYARRHGADQLFLREMIYPLVRGDALIHSDLVRFEGEVPRPFPTPRRGLEFVGQIVRADGSTVERHLELLRAAVPRDYSLEAPPLATRWIAAARRNSWLRVLAKRICMRAATSGATNGANGVTLD